MNISAKAMGVTTQRLEEMVKAGLSAEEFMPKFAKALRASVRENDALAASMQKVEAAQTRFKNTVTEASDALFNSGGALFLKATFDALSDTVNIIALPFKALSFILKQLFGDFQLGNEVIQSVSFAIKALAAVLMSRLVPSLMSTGPAAAKAAVGMRMFAGSMLAATAAAKALMRAVPFLIAFEALAWGASALDKHVFNPGQSSGSGRGGNTTNNSTTQVQVDIANVSGVDASDLANNFRDELSFALASDSDTAGIS